MKRLFLGVAAACALLTFTPALATAKIVELGQTKTPLVAPVCPPGVQPADCTIILPWVTALQTLSDRVLFPTKATADGQIVAFTVGLSALTSDRNLRAQYIHNLNNEFGGPTQVKIAVLHQTAQLTWKVVAQSPPVQVQPWLGYVVQFPLQKTLPIHAGELVALTTPTWAPVLAIDLSQSLFRYRQSRLYNCQNAPARPDWQRVGQSQKYNCYYDGTRVEYTATEITNPVPPPNYVKAADGAAVAAAASRSAFDSGGIGF